MCDINSSKLVIFTAQDRDISLDVQIKNETIWLNRNQISQLFDRDIKTIGKHINNALTEELSELSESSVVAKIATTATDGKIYKTAYYSLDVVISVGYRVKSKRGVEFRRWATEVLKQYIVHGYALNNKRMEILGRVVEILKETEKNIEAQQVLSVIEQYASALDMLDDYDHQCILKPQGSKTIYTVTYEECLELIEHMRFSTESELFGKEKDNSFRGSLGAVYQSFSNTEMYPTVEEKAVNFLYFIIKNHSFVDGNKRIGAALFLYFLDKNKILFYNGTKIIDSNTLVALTIMIAESKPNEKELMINLVMNFLVKNK